jgi:hypothetical protein
MRSRSKPEMVEGIQYAAFWLANEIHKLPRDAAFPTLLREISDDAIDLAVRCTAAGRQITAVLTDALATKLHGDPDSEYRLEWTEEERLDSAFLVVSAFHMEALRRRGSLDVRKLSPDPWAPDAVFECRLTGGRRVRLLNAWGLMEVFLPRAWRCPPDFAVSDVAARRHERRMSKRRQSTWTCGSLFPSASATGHVC